MWCSIPCAIFFQPTEYKYSKIDSDAHIKNVAIAKRVICDSIDSNPSLAIKLCSLCTTKST